MDNVLKRLLDSETRAEAVIEAAEQERKRIVDSALEEAWQAEERFQLETERRREPVLMEAEERAEQMVADLTRKFEARQRALRSQADQNEDEAVKAALALLLDPDL